MSSGTNNIAMDLRYHVVKVCQFGYSGRDKLDSMGTDGSMENFLIVEKDNSLTYLSHYVHNTHHIQGLILQNSVVSC